MRSGFEGNYVRTDGSEAAILPVSWNISKPGYREGQGGDVPRVYKCGGVWNMSYNSW